MASMERVILQMVCEDITCQSSNASLQAERLRRQSVPLTAQNVRCIQTSQASLTMRCFNYLSILQDQSERNADADNLFSEGNCSVRVIYNMFDLKNRYM